MITYNSDVINKCFVNEQYSRGVIVVALGCHVQCCQTVARLSRNWCTALQQKIDDCIMTATRGAVQRRQTILSFIQFTLNFTDYRRFVTLCKTVPYRNSLTYLLRQITIHVNARCKHQRNQVKSLNGDNN